MNEQGGASLGPVFVFGCAWRCGSTLLQRYLNSTGRMFVWGENVGLVTSLGMAFDAIASWDALSAEQSAAYETQRETAWVAKLNPPLLNAATITVRAALDAYYGPATLARGLSRWGFKEVRHGEKEARLLLSAYPNARIVFLVRRFDDVLASNAATSWFDSVGGAEGVAAQWASSCHSMRDLSDPRVLVLRYEDLCASSRPATARIAAHLDVPHDCFDANVLSARVRGSPHLPQRSKGLIDVQVITQDLMPFYYPEEY